MDSSIPLQVAETIQTTSINYSPSVAHDANPSTAASQKQPVTLSHHAGSTSDLETYDEIDGHEALDDEDDEDEDEDDIPYDVLRPVRRRKSLPPLPDLRFEQSYLASIKDADTNWKVAYITIRDQVVLPLVQGTIWSLALHGWKFWNRSAQINGSSIGARVRRWWWRTNNWEIKREKSTKLAREVSDYYQYAQGAGGD